MVRFRTWSSKSFWINRYLCVDLDCLIIWQALRSLILNLSEACTTASRRRAGLKSFPSWPLLKPKYLKIDQKWFFSVSDSPALNLWVSLLEQCPFRHTLFSTGNTNWEECWFSDMPLRSNDLFRSRFQPCVDAEWSALVWISVWP